LRPALIFAFLILLGGIFFWKLSPSKEKEKTYLVTEQKPFVLVICSYNNSKYIEKNLQSVFSQNYDNYRILYIDDNSSDDTLSKANTLLGDHPKATLISNPTNQGALANIYNAVHSCQDHEIIVPLDGDDFLAHENVLNILNETYANPDVWLTYSNYLDYPTYTQNPVICKKLSHKESKNRTFRKNPWCITPLRSFYAALFKQIKIEDLFYRGHFYSMGSDCAFMFPMLEMASTHIAFIDKCLYLYNRENPISDHKINFAFQQECATHIRLREPYQPLKKLPHETSEKKETADLLIFSYDRPLHLYALLESTNRYAVGLNKICVLYRSSSKNFAKGYQEVEIDFPNIQFIEQKNPPYDFKALCSKLILEKRLHESNHILFAPDTLVLKDFVDLSKAIAILNETKATGFYLGHHPRLTLSAHSQKHQPIPSYSPLSGVSSDEAIYAWQFSFSSGDWEKPDPLSFVLFRKKDLQKTFETIDFTTPKTLKKNLTVFEEGVGLFYNEGKWIHCNKGDTSGKELLEVFLAGLKIDINPFFQAHSTSQEAEVGLSFTTRE